MNRFRRLGWFVACAGIAVACGDDTPAGEAGTTGGSSTGSTGVDQNPSVPTGLPGSTGDEPTDTSGDSQSTGASTSVGTTTATTGSTSSPTDTGTTGAAVGCDAGDYLVCEDFEDAALGGNPDQWDLRESGVFGGNGMGTTDEDAALGSQSFRIEGGTSGAQWLTYMGDISMLADGHWGRMYVRMGTPIPWPQSGVIHGDLFEARGNWNGSTHQVRWAAIENAQMQHNWGYNVQTSNAGEFIHETAYIYSWPEDWFCLEWHHDQDAQEATLWVDGEEILAVTAADDPQLPTFDDISVGWANYQNADPQFVVYLDEVVLDDERVGCMR